MSAARKVIGVLITAKTLLDHTPVIVVLATSSIVTDTHVMVYINDQNRLLV
jgi:hypothetical protein